MAFRDALHTFRAASTVALENAAKALASAEAALEAARQRYDAACGRASAPPEDGAEPSSDPLADAIAAREQVFRAEVALEVARRSHEIAAKAEAQRLLEAKLKRRQGDAAAMSQRVASIKKSLKDFNTECDKLRQQRDKAKMSHDLLREDFSKAAALVTPVLRDAFLPWICAPDFRPESILAHGANPERETRDLADLDELCGRYRTALAALPVEDEE
jgi:hypothetical protein